MQNYLDLGRDIMENGNDKTDRTGTGTRSVFARQLRWDLGQGFPLVTAKRTAFKLVVSELLWFMKGDTNIRYLLQHNNHIWDEWAFLNYIKSEDYEGQLGEDFGVRAAQDPSYKIIVDEEMKEFCSRILEDPEFAEKYGELGPVYGKQWRKWTVQHEDPDGVWYDEITVDQFTDVISQIKNNPDSRRLLVSAWNPAEIGNMALPPCHYSFQFYVANGKLSLLWNQRSVDYALGLPFNIASYSILTHLVAQECDLEVGEVIFSGADIHIYNTHFEGVEEMLEREPKPLPTIQFPNKPIFEMEPEDITLHGYDPHPSIKFPIAV